MRPRTRACLLSLSLLVLCGCATLPPGKRDPRDPWERMNRTTYKFNDALDRAILQPTARWYLRLPRPLRSGFRNFLDNLDYSMTIVNDLLQGQPKAFVSDTARLVLNTTIGIGGIFDPATHAGLEKNNRDLGQTFGKWGIKSGPYLVVPLLGPYTVRDGIGSLGDEFLTPRHYIKNLWVNYSLWAFEKVDERSALIINQPAIDAAYDPYGLVRRVYLDYRDFKVNGSGSTHEQEQELKLLEEAGEDEETPAPAKTPPPAPDTPPPK